ncbi:permease [Leeuwenhoekiella sp. W20_SRS_FM14]|uniref:permease n=1 Tax=Leeuwenhoekiella sp. W20_SRS_FM14 TaxID=3240270 RepID=UPI003F95DDF7
MDVKLQKTFLFLVFIALGLLLKFKIKGKQELAGIKMIILNLALPATIFIALLSIQVEASLLILPIIALLINVVLLFITPLVLPVLAIRKNTPNYRSAHLLLPSLAPGLSCFPFILEYLGEEYLAKAAMADLGNKLFVLLILYLVAMRWHYKTQGITGKSKVSKFKNLCLAMISEPVNVLIVAALILLCTGFNLTSLPYLISESFSRLSILMTPLVLLFIGLSVNVKRSQFFEIASLLLVRAGVVIFLCVGIILITEIELSQDRLLLLAFGLSACSFWPFAHIAAVDKYEKKVAEGSKTFNQNYAISILAISFPLSVVLILGILTAGNQFADITTLVLLASLLLLLGFVYPLILKFSKVNRNQKEEIIHEIEGSYTLRQVSDN